MRSRKNVVVLLTTAAVALGGLCATAAAAATGPGPFPSAAGQKQTGRLASGFLIVSNMNNKCLNVRASNAGAGAAVAMWTCDGNANELWSEPGDGTIRTLLDTSKCLDLDDVNPAIGAGIDIWPCNGSSAQQFSFNGNEIRNANGTVLDISDSNPFNGACVQMWSSDSTSNQSWRVG